MTLNSEISRVMGLGLHLGEWVGDLGRIFFNLLGRERLWVPRARGDGDASVSAPRVEEGGAVGAALVWRW